MNPCINVECEPTTIIHGDSTENYIVNPDPLTDQDANLLTDENGNSILPD